MAALTVAILDLTGVIPAAVDAAATAGGDTFANNGNTFFYADNAGGADIEISFDDTGTPTPGGTIDAFDPDVTVDVTAGTIAMIGPFPTQRFGTTVSVTYEGVVSLTVAAIRY